MVALPPDDQLVRACVEVLSCHLSAQVGYADGGRESAVHGHDAVEHVADGFFLYWRKCDNVEAVILLRQFRRLLRPLWKQLGDKRRLHSLRYNGHAINCVRAKTRERNTYYSRWVMQKHTKPSNVSNKRCRGLDGARVVLARRARCARSRCLDDARILLARLVQCMSSRFTGGFGSCRRDWRNDSRNLRRCRSSRGRRRNRLVDVHSLHRPRPMRQDVAGARSRSGNRSGEAFVVDLGDRWRARTSRVTSRAAIVDGLRQLRDDEVPWVRFVPSVGRLLAPRANRKYEIEFWEIFF